MTQSSIVFKPIPQDPNFEISECGVVRNNVSGRTVKSFALYPKNYRVVRLRYGKTQYLHRLIAFAWLPPPPTDKHVQVAHLDGNPEHNHASNLKWTTISENLSHRRAHGTMPVMAGMSEKKLSDDDVRYVMASHETNFKLAAKFKCSTTLISRIRNGHVRKLPGVTSVSTGHQRQKTQGRYANATKLTEQNVRDIRKMLAMTPRLSQRQIGALFGVTSATISKINTGQHWSHVK